MKVTLEVVLFEKLTRFVLARIIDREQAAQRAGGGEWLHRSRYRHQGSEQEVYGTSGPVANVECLYGWHIALNDPAHVLARCAAERALVRTVITFETDPKWDAFGAEGDYAWLILTHLALADAGHPDFQEEWGS